MKMKDTNDKSRKTNFGPLNIGKPPQQLLSNMSNRSFNSILVTLLVAAVTAGELKVEVYDGPKGMSKFWFTSRVYTHILKVFSLYTSSCHDTTIECDDSQKVKKGNYLSMHYIG